MEKTPGSYRILSGVLFSDHVQYGEIVLNGNMFSVYFTKHEILNFLAVLFFSLTFNIQWVRVFMCFYDNNTWLIFRSRKVAKLQILVS